MSFCHCENWQAGKFIRILTKLRNASEASTSMYYLILSGDSNYAKNRRTFFHVRQNRLIISCDYPEKASAT
jgi:hypothetical protein